VHALQNEEKIPLGPLFTYIVDKQTEKKMTEFNVCGAPAWRKEVFKNCVSPNFLLNLDFKQRQDEIKQNLWPAYVGTKPRSFWQRKVVTITDPSEQCDLMIKKILQSSCQNLKVGEHLSFPFVKNGKTLQDQVKSQCSSLKDATMPQKLNSQLHEFQSERLPMIKDPYIQSKLYYKVNQTREDLLKITSSHIETVRQKLCKLFQREWEQILKEMKMMLSLVSSRETDYKQTQTYKGSSTEKKKMYAQLKKMLDFFIAGYSYPLYYKTYVYVAPIQNLRELYEAYLAILLQLNAMPPLFQEMINHLFYY
jgi:hypothetical protein